MLAHLRRAGGAVQADHVDAERLQRGQRRADLRAEQHRAGGLDGDLGEDRHVHAGGGHRALGADDRGLGLQQVLRGLDQQRVDPAVDQAAALARRRRAGRRRARGPGWAAWCPARPSRAPSAAGRASRSRRRPRGRSARRPRPARGSGPRCRTPPGSPGWRRRCWSRRSRRRRRGTPRARCARCPGRVTLRISLQPSWPSKSSSDGSGACSIVPMAPSATTTRVARASRRAAMRAASYTEYAPQVRWTTRVRGRARPRAADAAGAGSARRPWSCAGKRR